MIAQHLHSAPKLRRVTLPAMQNVVNPHVLPSTLSRLPPTAASLLRGLLSKDPTSRLGSPATGGVAALKVRALCAGCRGTHGRSCELSVPFAKNNNNAIRLMLSALSQAHPFFSLPPHVGASPEPIDWERLLSKGYEPVWAPDAVGVAVPSIVGIGPTETPPPRRPPPLDAAASLQAVAGRSVVSLVSRQLQHADVDTHYVDPTLALEQPIDSAASPPTSTELAALRAVGAAGQPQKYGAQQPTAGGPGAVSFSAFSYAPSAGAPSFSASSYRGQSLASQAAGSLSWNRPHGTGGASEGWWGDIDAALIATAAAAMRNSRGASLDSRDDDGVFAADDSDRGDTSDDTATTQVPTLSEQWMRKLDGEAVGTVSHQIVTNAHDATDGTLDSDTLAVQLLTADAINPQKQHPQQQSEIVQQLMDLWGPPVVSGGQQ